jgi:hypothetical protein
MRFRGLTCDCKERGQRALEQLKVNAGSLALGKRLCGSPAFALDRGRRLSRCQPVRPSDLPRACG